MFKVEWVNETAGELIPDNEEHEDVPHNFNLYWDNEKINENPIYNPRSGKYRSSGGSPVNAEKYASSWVASQSVPDETKLQDAIQQLAAIIAGDFEEIEDGTE